MTKRLLLALACGLLAATQAARAAEPTFVPLPNSTFPISLAVRVPAGAETIYFSGMVPGVVNPNAPKDTAESYGGNTEAQANSAFDRLEKALKSQGLGFGNIVELHVYLVGDAATGGRMDFAGFQAAYTKYFATAAQPNKPARSAVQVAGLAGPGMLVEIEAIAVK